MGVVFQQWPVKVVRVDASLVENCRFLKIIEIGVAVDARC